MTQPHPYGGLVPCQFVRAVRKRHNLTQEQFAIALGVTEGTVVRIERGGNTHGSTLRLVQMFDRFGVPDWALT